MERIIRIYPSHRAADDAERSVLSAMSPQDRLDRALTIQARYREELGDAGQGLARVARAVPFVQQLRSDPVSAGHASTITTEVRREYVDSLFAGQL